MPGVSRATTRPYRTSTLGGRRIQMGGATTSRTRQQCPPRARTSAPPGLGAVPKSRARKGSTPAYARSHSRPDAMPSFQDSRSGQRSQLGMVRSVPVRPRGAQLGAVGGAVLRQMNSTGCLGTENQPCASRVGAGGIRGWRWARAMFGRIASIEAMIWSKIGRSFRYVTGFRSVSIGRS